LIATHGKDAIRDALNGRIDPEAMVITDGLRRRGMSRKKKGGPPPAYR
jgi:hypothetical protein